MKTKKFSLSADNNSENFKSSLNSFLRLEKQYSLTSCAPLSDKNDKEVCINTQEYGMAPYSISASAFIVHTDAKGTYALTAEHFCSDEQMNEAFTQISPSSKNLRTHIKTTRIASFVSGRAWPYVVVATSAEKDLCLVLLENYYSEYRLRIADHHVLAGAKVFNIAAPLNVFETGFVPIFQGLYSGSASNGEAIRHMYTFPSISGSSGSPVINTEGEVLAMVVSVLPQFVNLSFAVGINDIEVFFDDMLIYIN